MGNATAKLDEQHDTPNVDARFRLSVSRDKCSVIMDNITPHSGNGKPITKEQILPKLKKQKIVNGLDLALIDEAIAQIAEGNIPENGFVIVKASAPEHGEDGDIKWHIDPKTIETTAYIIRPNEAIFTVKPATKGKDGKDIFGKPVRARPGANKAIQTSDDFLLERIDEDHIEYRAKFFAQLTLKDEKLALEPLIHIDDDHLQAHIKLPATCSLEQNPANLTLDSVISAIEHAGIKEGLQEETLKQWIEAYPQTHANECLIAKGTPVKDGVDCHIDWKLDIQNESIYQRAVHPDQVVMVYTPATPMQAGKDVFGNSIEGKTAIDTTVQMDNSFKKTEEDQIIVYRAKWLGIIEGGDTGFHINPRITVSGDKMEATMEIFPRACDEHMITAADILATLKLNGVIYGFSEEKIQSTLEKLNDAATNAGHFDLSGKTVIAEGVGPVDGIDETLSMAHHLEAGKKDEDGKIDFHERSYTWDVKAGDNIGKISNAVPPKNGVNILGESIQGREPVLLELQIEGIERQPDGTLTAQTDGTLLVSDNMLTVTDLLVIDSSIDQHTGNIHTTQSVQVNGFVTAGFIVESEQNILIKENVEGGTITAGKNIKVESGIRGHHSKVNSSGSLSAGFIEQTSVKAEQGIQVKNSCINAELESGEYVRVGDTQKKNGIFIGGSIKADSYAQAGTFGSEAYVKTSIEVGLTKESREKMDSLTKLITEKCSELDNLDRIHYHLYKNPKAGQEEVLNKVTNTKTAVIEAIDQSFEELDKLHEHLQTSKEGKVVVLKECFPGVTIKIYDQAYKVTEHLKSGTFLLKDEKLVFDAGQIATGDASDKQ